MSNRYTWRPTPDHPERMDVIDPDGVAVCWLPRGACEAVMTAYKHIWLKDPIIAREFMKGYLFGVHHALLFGNQIPPVRAEVIDGELAFQMMEAEG